MDKKGSIGLAGVVAIVAIIIVVGAAVTFVAMGNSSNQNNNSEETETDGSCRVSYNSNGGLGSVTGVEYDSGTAVTVNSCTFYKSGYTFVKWNTKSDGSGTSYAVGDKITVTSNVTLFAIWEKNASGNDVVYNYKIVKTANSFTYNIEGISHVYTYTPASGYKVVIVDIVVKNNSYTAGFGPSIYDFDLKCADGNGYEVANLATMNYSDTTDNISNVKLGVGSSLTYTVVYEILSGTSASSLSWEGLNFAYTVGKDSSLMT